MTCVTGAHRPLWIAREGNNTGALIDSESPTGFGRWLQDFAVRTAYRRADRIVAISGGVRDALTRRFHLDTKQVTTIFNAVDLKAVRMRAQEAPLESPRRPFIVAGGEIEMVSRGEASARRLKLERVLWFCGPGGNGKSTAMRVLRYVIGDGVTSAVGLEAPPEHHTLGLYHPLLQELAVNGETIQHFDVAPEEEVAPAEAAPRAVATSPSGCASFW